MFDTDTKGTPQTALQRPIQLLLDSAGNRQAISTGETIARTLYESPKVGTMRAWMQAHDGQTVTTIQANLDGTGLWAPVGRWIDAASLSSAVKLAGSRRDYAGMRVIAADDNCLIVADSHQVAAYVIEEN